jgi:Na+-transporting NADH:ubiquinone oxidoreductase subunit NqrF
MPRIIVHKNGQTIEKDVLGNITLLEALRITGNFPPSPCNGKGTCGKCRVLVKRGIDFYTDQEKKILSIEEMRKGIHLSCMIRVNDDIEVTLPDTSGKASILT